VNRNVAGHTCHAVDTVDVLPFPHLPDVWRVRPHVHHDERGFFCERWSDDDAAALGLPAFVQANHSRSQRWVLRGLHFQAPPAAQGKLVSAVRGRVFDVAVDLRIGSPTFGRWAGTTLDAEHPEHVWVPPGFAHGFLTLSSEADVVYKVTAGYAPAVEGGVAWDDPDIGIEWPLEPGRTPRLSAKDTTWPRLADVSSPFSVSVSPDG